MYINRYPLLNGMAYRIINIALLAVLMLTPTLSSVSQASNRNNITDLNHSQALIPVDSLRSADTTNLLGTGNDKTPNQHSNINLSTNTNSDWWAQVQEEIRNAEYSITWQESTYLDDLESAYQAPNRAQDLRIYFTSQGIHLIPRSIEGDMPTWDWGLTLSDLHDAEDKLSLSLPGQQVHGQRIEYNRGSLTEWYINDQHGLQQGIALHAPPVQDGVDDDRVEIAFTLFGNLIPSINADSMAIVLSSASGEDVLGYSVRSITDVEGREIPAQLAIKQDTLSMALDTRHATYPIQVLSVITRLSSTPNWTAESNQLLAYFGDALSTAGDVNGDGYSDVIIGADSFDSGQTDEGRVFVYHGSSSGLSTAPAWSAESNQAYAKFGSSVSIAGDVNGDGYTDVVIGAAQYDNGQTDEGAAFIFHGSKSGLSDSPTWIAESDQSYAHFGASVGTAGDVNRDGYSDVIIGIPLYNSDQDQEGRVVVFHGGVNGLSDSPNWAYDSHQSGASFGSSVGTAGDVNGDGFSDVIVGAYSYTNGQDAEGGAFIYHGGLSGLSTTPNLVVESNKAYAYFGWSVTTAGDVNGDGFSDVVIGAPYFTNDQTYEGRAYVYQGSASGLSVTPSWMAESDQFGAQYGASVGTAGDVNGDGYSDIVIGAPDYDNDQEDEGRAFIYIGGIDGLSSNPLWTAESDQIGAKFGSQVATCGDVNGDGYNDVLIGAPDYDNGQEDEGGAFVFYGSVGDLSATPSWSADGAQDGAYFGWSLGTAGDVNGDGYGDVIIGARRYDNGQTDEGRVYVYHGGANGLNLNPAWIVESNQDGAWFGGSVGTAGDVNGDGYSDVIVGASSYDDGEEKEGSAFVYLGSAEGLRASPAWKAEGDQVYASFGCSVGTAGDVNGDGYSDVIIGAMNFDNEQTDEGRAFVYLGRASGLRTTPHWTAEGDVDDAGFGYSVGTAGDVNGDGYSDVIIGAPGYDSDQDSEGRAFVYLGGPDGLVETPQWIEESNQSFANFGWSVGTAGDVNGDGFSDVIIGAVNYDNGEDYEGRAYVYLGLEDGLSTSPHWTAEGDQAGAAFGSAVGTAGDVNGDGFSDVVIGVPGYDSGQDGEGRAYVYLGSLNGLGDSPHWAAEGDQVYAHFGSSVGSAGDVNGDGYSEVIIGTPYYDNVWLNVGSASLYYGNGGLGLPLLPQQLRRDGSAPIAYLGMSPSGISFYLSLLGRSPMGREMVKLQWQVAPLGMMFSDPSVLQGYSTGWIDSGTQGNEIFTRIDGLTPGMAYHWRVRLIYPAGNASGQRSSRWIHIPWSGWHETDMRTASHQIYLPIAQR